MQLWRPGPFQGWERRGWADLPAGLAVAAYIIPQCLAYARLAGLEPVAGLWAAVPALLIYTVVGTSPLLSIGPESSSAVLVGSAVAALSASGAVAPGAAAAALALAVAAVAATGWVLRAGFLADLLSRPVVVGFLAGVGVSMVASQLPRLFALESSADEPWRRLLDVARHLDDIRVAPTLLGSGVLVGLLVLRRWRALPGPLLVLGLAAVIHSVADLAAHGVTTVGAIPRGLPRPALPALPGSMWVVVFLTAVGITLVAFSGNIVTARAFARPQDHSLNANRELLAVAGTNLGAGLFGGFPVSSSDSRTALAAAAGGSSHLVSVIAAVCIMATLGFGGEVVGALPLPALAGLVVYAAIALVDLVEIRRVVAFRKSEALIMAAAFVGVVGFDVLVGIGVAVALSVADLFRRVARAHDAIQGSVPGLAGLHDIKDYPNAETVPGLVVYRYDAPLCFANADDFRTRVLAAVRAETEPVAWVVLNMEANVETDLTAIDMLDSLRTDLEGRGIVLALARVKHDLAIYLDRTGFTARVGPERIYPTLPTALNAFHQRRTQ